MFEELKGIKSHTSALWSDKIFTVLWCPLVAARCSGVPRLDNASTEAPLESKISTILQYPG